MRDYVRWHDDYADPNSNNSARLRRVRGLIAAELDARLRPAAPAQPLLRRRPRHPRRARGAPRGRRPHHRPHRRAITRPRRNRPPARTASIGADIEVVCADAGDPRNAVGAIPADLVLLVGIMGDISEDDILYLARTSASFCAPGAYLIWSRGGQYTDLNARIDASFAEAGFTEREFFTEPPHKYGLGTARWPHAETPALPLDRQLFTFTRWPRAGRDARTVGCKPGPAPQLRRVPARFGPFRVAQGPSRFRDEGRTMTSKTFRAAPGGVDHDDLRDRPRRIWSRRSRSPAAAPSP